MTDDDDLPVPSMVDALFPLEGRALPRDWRWALSQALEGEAPWLRELPQSGLHSLNLVHGGGDTALLSHRARLGLRLPRTHAGLAAQLAGRELDVAGHRVRLGAPHVRELLLHGTLYAHLVAAEVDDEADFVRAVDAELDALGAACRRVCGRRQRIGTDDAPLVGFSLMLHGLSAAHALRVLESGVGAHRRLGCGVFVPHRSAAAVGT
jgi:CRISPR-associated protein Cas6